MRIVPIFLALAFFPLPANAALDAAWRATPVSVPAESLGARLRSLELRPALGVTAGEASFALGQFHYARGEYRQASDAFLRSAGRLTGQDHAEARYWCGLASLAFGNAEAARIAFADAPAARRALAQLGTALAFEMEGRPDKAYDTLKLLLGRESGEATAPALDRFAVLAAQFHHEDEARAARGRLLRECSGTIEAARLAAAPLAAPPPDEVAVQIGVFTDPARARTLAVNARRAGFREAVAIERRGPDGRASMWVVQLGRYLNRDEARLAGERVQRALGVGWQVEKQ